jgi:hypothetical protein
MTKEQKALSKYMSLSQDEKREMQRYSIEIDALGEKFFTPTDIEHNKKVLGYIKEYEQNHAKKFFKYVSYEQMENIFIKGTLKKEQIECNLIISNDGYLDMLEFDTVADKFKKFREVGKNGK